MEKKTLTGIIIAIALVAIFIGIFIYYSNYLKEKHFFTYKGVKGNYEFEEAKLEGVKGTFYKATFFIRRDDGKLYSYYTMFRNSPYDLEKIPLDQVSDEILYNKDDKKDKIYITQDPELPTKSEKTSTIAVLDIKKITGCMGSVCIYGVPTEMAFTNLTAEFNNVNVDQITCNNATSKVGVILIKIGEKNRIYREKDNCVILEAKTYDDITKVTDKFLMHLIGIF